MDKRVFHLVSPDNITLHATETLLPGNPRAVIVLVHGQGEHSGRYPHVISALTAQQFKTFTFDLRGHGLSEGQRGHFESMDQILDDLQLLVDQVEQAFPDIPKFLYGHSLGGNIVLSYVISRQHPFKACVVTSPIIRLGTEPTELKLKVARTLASMRPTVDFRNDLDRSGLSRDPAVVSAYINDPQVHDRVSARGGVAIVDNCAWLVKNAQQLKLTTLLMQGTADRIVNPLATRDFAHKTGPNVTYREWDGYYHELHNEPEREQVIDFMISWLNSQLS